MLGYLLFLFACSDCDSPTGTLEICLANRNTIPVGAKVHIANDAAFTEPMEAMIEEDGCVSLDLEPGVWYAYAEDPQADCRSEDLTATVRACVSITLTADIEEMCVG